MTSVADIEDRDSLEAWLQTQPREAAIAIAARAAARVMPIWAEACRKQGVMGDLTPLPVLRAELISAVAAVSPSYDIKRAASAAAEAATDAFANVATTGAYAAADAVDDADIAALATAAAVTDVIDATYDGTSAYNGTTDYGATAITTSWNAVQTDAATHEAGQDLTRRPLWPAENPLEDLWQITREDWSRPGSPYGFWARWYESLLTGTPMSPDMLHQIALIDNDIWSEGAEATAEEIARIEERFRLLAEIHALRQDLAAARAGFADRVNRSGNYPEGMEPLPVLDADLAEADAELAKAETELLQARPSPGILRRAAAGIGRAAKALGLYGASKADKVIDTALAEGTKQAMKWGVGLLGVGFIDRMLDLSEALLKFADKLPWP